MKNKHSLMFFVLGLLPTTVWASDNGLSFVENFEKRSAKLESILVQAPNSAVASEKILAQSDSRYTVFQLQAMGRVLTAIHSDFSFLKLEFKKIEDAIGEHKKWFEMGQTDKQQVAAQKFTDLIEQGGWIGADGQFAQIKSNFAFAIDKNNITEAKVIEYWLSQLEKIKTNKYDFGQLEGKLGLHEFKRDIRWVLLEMGVFPNVVGLDTEIENCPLKTEYVDYALETMDHKYAKMASSKEAQSHIAVSACLVSTLAHLVEDIDALKTDSEKFLKEHTDNKVPKDIKAKAMKSYELFKKSKVTSLLIKEIKSQSN